MLFVKARRTFVAQVNPFVMGLLFSRAVHHFSARIIKAFLIA